MRSSREKSDYLRRQVYFLPDEDTPSVTRIAGQQQRRDLLDSRMPGKCYSVDSAVEELAFVYQSQRGVEHWAAPMETFGGDLGRVFPELLSLDQPGDILFQIAPFASFPG